MGRMDALTIQKIESPAFLGDVVEHITSGGALPDLCQSFKIKYSHVITWLYAAPERAEAYERALKARVEWIIQSILNELKDIALVDMREAYDDKGQLLPVDRWPRALSRAVQAIETSADGVSRIKFWDKLRALELIGKHLKLFRETVDINSTMSLEELVNYSIEKKEIVSEGGGGDPAA